MPEGYEYDWQVFSISPTILEEKEVWEMDYVQVVKRFMFERYKGFIEKKMMERG